MSLQCRRDQWCIVRYERHALVGDEGIHVMGSRYWQVLMQCNLE